MIILFTEKDLVSFGNYILQDIVGSETEVTKEDLEKWAEKQSENERV